MTNNQNLPDRLFIGKVGIHRLAVEKPVTGTVEYISSEKVREIQLATIRATLEAAIKRFILAEKDMVPNPISVLKNIKPESIIEQVKI